MNQALRGAIKGFLKDTRVLIPLLIGGVLWLASFSIAYIQIFPIDATIIGHLNARGEIDAIIDAQSVMFIIIELALLLGVNTLLSFVLYVRERVLSYVLLYASVWVMALGTLMIYALTVMN